MKNYNLHIYRLLYFIFLLILNVQLSLAVAQEKVYTETLSYDKEKIISYQKSAKYDYNSQLSTPDASIIDLLNYWLSKALGAIFGNRFALEYTEPIMICIFVLMIVMVLFFIFKKRPELFFRNQKKKLAYHLDEETIYDVDFEEEIRTSIKNREYKLAIRFVYLQTLRYLHDNQLIDWQPYKTPTEYIYELKKKISKEQFRQLTNHFLRVRYGNFDATEETFLQVRALQEVIQKGGTNEEE